MNEFDLISTYFSPLSAKVEGALHLTDDAAIIPPPGAGYVSVVTTDNITEGVHYPKAMHFYTGEEFTPADVARRLVRVNLSDIAAVGGTPHYYLIAAVFSRTVDEHWIAQFAQGLQKEQEIYGITLIGGDTVRHHGPTSLSLTMIGQVRKDRVITRAGAKAGDRIFVTGTIGDSALGLKALQGELKGISAEHRSFLVNRYRLPEPRVDIGKKLGNLAHAAIDVSDGLLADLGHICECSKVGAKVYRNNIPLSEAARQAIYSDSALWEIVLTGGDDYELVFTAPEDARGTIEKYAKSFRLRISEIGEMTAEVSGVVILDSKGKELSFAKTGFTHF